MPDRPNDSQTEGRVRRPFDLQHLTLGVPFGASPFCDCTMPHALDLYISQASRTSTHPSSGIYWIEEAMYVLAGGSIVLMDVRWQANGLGLLVATVFMGFGVFGLTTFRLIPGLRVLTFLGIPHAADLMRKIDIIAVASRCLFYCCLLLFLCLCCYGVFAIHWFRTDLSRRCVVAGNASYEILLPVTYCANATSAGGGSNCPATASCQTIGNPNFGFTSFDEMLPAFLIMLQTITHTGLPVAGGLDGFGPPWRLSSMAGPQTRGAWAFVHVHEGSALRGACECAGMGVWGMPGHTCEFGQPQPRTTDHTDSRL